MWLLIQRSDYLSTCIEYDAGHFKMIDWLVFNIVSISGRTVFSIQKFKTDVNKIMGVLEKKDFFFFKMSHLNCLLHISLRILTVTDAWMVHKIFSFLCKAKGARFLIIHFSQIKPAICKKLKNYIYYVLIPTSMFNSSISFLYLQVDWLDQLLRVTCIYSSWLHYLFTSWKSSSWARD